MTVEMKLFTYVEDMHNMCLSYLFFKFVMISCLLDTLFPECIIWATYFSVLLAGKSFNRLGLSRFKSVPNNFLQDQINKVSGFQISIRIFPYTSNPFRKCWEFSEEKQTKNRDETGSDLSSRTRLTRIKHLSRKR